MIKYCKDVVCQVPNLIFLLMKREYVMPAEIMRTANP